jgi:hypothetical protein
MATDNPTPAGTPPGNFSDDITARLTGMTQLALAVDIEPSLACIEVKIRGLAGEWSVLIGTMPALDLCFRVIGAVTRLRRLEIGDGSAS